MKMISLESIYMELTNFRRNDISVIDTKASPNNIDEFLKGKGFTQEPFDTNGWDVDFDITYLNGNTKIRHIGNWYYGSSSLRIEKI